MFRFLPRKARGFTLIEVLIALAILSIAMTSIIYSMSRMIRDTAYLQDKTIALWVGKQAINELTAQVISFKENTESLENETVMLGKKWRWKAQLTQTPNSNIKKITVDVSLFSHSTSIIQLTSFLYVKNKTWCRPDK